MHLNINLLSSVDMYLRQGLHFSNFVLSSPSDKLSKRFYNELDINLKLSINFNFYVIVLALSSSFLIGTEKVIYFSVFSSEHSN